MKKQAFYEGYGDIPVTCNTCKEVKDFSCFAAPNKTTPTGICRVCNREKARKAWENQLRAYKVEENPENYMFCSDCKNIFNFRGRGRPSTFRPYTSKAVRTECPKCGSENFEDYMEVKAKKLLTIEEREK